MLDSIGHLAVDWDENLAGAVIIATSTVDASAAVAAGWYRLIVSGAPAYLNIGSAATSANVLFPVGAEDEPKFRAAGTYHALAALGTGQVAFIPYNPA